MKGKLYFIQNEIERASHFAIYGKIKQVMQKSVMSIFLTSPTTCYFLIDAVISNQNASYE